MMKFMKKYISILLALLTLGMVGQGCTERLDVPDSGTSEGETCLNFSVAVAGADGAATRSFASEKIQNLWVLVFDENEFFVECKEASPVSPNTFGTDMNTEYPFTVQLQASPTKRILHFIANYDFDSNPPEYNHEYYLISHLTVTGEAYWQRVELDDGLPEDMNDMPAEDLAKITKIPLVRNFSSVSIDVADDANFELEGFALWNTPDCGSVAPCVMAASDFATYATSDATPGDSNADNPWISRQYNDLKKSYNGTSTIGFTGYLPSSAGIVNTDASALDCSSNLTHYMFERPYSSDATNSAILVKGKYKNGSGNPSYYKVEFVQSTEISSGTSGATSGYTVYYNILRNFHYHVYISNCTADGYSTAAEAMAQPSANNFLFSVTTQDYSNISDGESRIFVEYTEKTVVSPSAFTFKLKYVPDIKNAPTTSENTSVHVMDKTTEMKFNPSTPAGEYTYTSSESSIVRKIEMESYQDASGNTVYTNPADGWTTFIVTPQALPDAGKELTQSVLFYVTKTVGSGSTSNTIKVARTVILHLRRPGEMTINTDSGDAAIPKAKDQSFLMNIYITSGLAKHMFPLEFKIESSTNNLTPDTSQYNTAGDGGPGYMPTWTGTSIIDSSKQSFGFTKTVTYEEYLQLETTGDGAYVTVPCAFKTTKAVTGTAGTTIYVTNPYFTGTSGGAAGTAATYAVNAS